MTDKALVERERIAKAADSLRGLSIKDAEGCGWLMNKEEREEAARRVLAALNEGAGQ